MRNLLLTIAAAVTALFASAARQMVTTTESLD